MIDQEEGKEEGKDGRDKEEEQGSNAEEKEMETEQVSDSFLILSNSSVIFNLNVCKFHKIGKKVEYSAQQISVCFPQCFFCIFPLIHPFYNAFSCL